uniref:Choline/carnitine acyltransferase domain-containing protein n=1 Tax=Gopherus agassizii TaxID=38772 RepID=A0A452H9Y4_9SAUR
MRGTGRSLFTVCLDAPVLKVSDERYPSRVAAQMLHGGGSYSNSGNRWFDKTLQVSWGSPRWGAGFTLPYGMVFPEPQITCVLGSP